MNPPIQRVFDLLFSHWGQQHWWPAESQLEMMLGAVLTQNTAWTNVEKAIENLRTHNALSLNALHHGSTEQLAEWIRPAGYYNQKAKYIKTMIDTICSRFHSSIDLLFELETPALRKELLSWKGIGPETADSILLYAANRPVFVVDAYTKRILIRHGWCTEKATYNEIAALFTKNLPEDVQLFNEYHALIVRLGKTHCQTKQKCIGCPLENYTLHG